MKHQEQKSRMLCVNVSLGQNTSIFKTVVKPIFFLLFLPNITNSFAYIANNFPFIPIRRSHIATGPMCNK